MTASQRIDLGHLMFLGLARSLMKVTGPASAKGMLIRNAIEAGEKVEPRDYPTFEDFVRDATEGTSPFAAIEGRVQHLGNGMFGLPGCPFAHVLTAYKEVFKTGPAGFEELVQEFNKPSPLTDRHHIGDGAGVSVFCSLHQPIRSVIANRVTIGGQPVVIYQLGCKTASGSRGLAERWIAAGRFSHAAVEQALDDHMCCYGVRVEGP